MTEIFASAEFNRTMGDGLTIAELQAVVADQLAKPLVSSMLKHGLLTISQGMGSEHHTVKYKIALPLN